MKKKFLQMNRKVGAKNKALVYKMTVEDYFNITKSEELKALVGKIRELESADERRELKNDLPFRCPHYFEFKNGHRCQAGIIPEAFTWMTCVDIDDMSQVEGAISRAYLLNDQEGLWNGMLLHAEKSASGKLHLDIRLPLGMTIREAQEAYTKELGIDFDEDCCTPERMIYITDAESQLYTSNDWYARLSDEELAQRRKAYTDRGLDIDGRELKNQPSSNEPENQPVESSEATDYPTEYKGIPYSYIVEELANQLGGKPEHGSRNTFIFSMACQLRHICNDDSKWIRSILPNYGEKQDRVNSTIDSACRRSQSAAMPIIMDRAIELAGARVKLENGYELLENKTVDTGFGLDRMLLFLNGLTDGYKTDLFWGAIEYLQEKSGKNYDEDETAQKAMRIIADHTRTGVMLIGDRDGILPSNTGAGYILRRLLRRAIRYCRSLGIDSKEMLGVATIFIDEVYNEAYPLLVEKKEYILDEIQKEIARFEATLEKGMKEFEKCVNGLQRKNEFMRKSNPDYQDETTIGGKQAFRLYDTYGFPVELTQELAAEKGFDVDMDGFNAAFKEHQEISKANVTAAKGGLESQSDAAIHYHTATHLLNAALKTLLSKDINQKGSNINDERMRFDFNFPRAVTEEELTAVENLVNEKIQENIPVVFEEMSLDEARAREFVGVFSAKYGETVKTYSIGNFSREICGGPHANSTGELGKFKIVKEQSCGAGIRRIKAVLEK